MSYELDVALDARAVGRGLEFEAQEAVLDELDRIAAQPFSLPRGAVVRDVVVEIAGVRHYVFIQLSVSHPRRAVNVYRLGHFASS